MTRGVPRRRWTRTGHLSEMHACECGHQPAEHYAETGHCEADEQTLWGVETCKCPRYEFQGDQ